MKPYNAQLAVGGAKLVTENGYPVRDVIFSVNYIAGIINQDNDFIGAMGLWDKISGVGVEVNGVRSPDLKMYEESPKEYWLALFAAGAAGIIGGVFKTEKEAFSFNAGMEGHRVNAGMEGHRVVKVVEVK